MACIWIQLLLILQSIQSPVSRWLSWKSAALHVNGRYLNCRQWLKRIDHPLDHKVWSKERMYHAVSSFKMQILGILLKNLLYCIYTVGCWSFHFKESPGDSKHVLDSRYLSLTQNAFYTSERMTWWQTSKYP